MCVVVCLDFIFVLSFYFLFLFRFPAVIGVWYVRFSISYYCNCTK